MLRGLLAYDGRHGWRGAEGHWDDAPDQWSARLARIPPVAGLGAVAAMMALWGDW